MHWKTVIKNFKSHLKWAESQTKDIATENAADQAEEIVGGVFDLLQYLPASLLDLESWLDRPVRGREAPRNYLDRIRTTFYKGQGKKAFVGLLVVVIEVLEAATWIDDVHVGSFPVAFRVPDQSGLGRQKIIAIDGHDGVNSGAESLEIGYHRKDLKTEPIDQDDQSHTVGVFNDSDCVFNRVSDANSRQDRELVQSKICSNCGDDKPPQEYYAHPSTADGLQSQCKSCVKAGVERRRSLLGDAAVVVVPTATTPSGGEVCR